MSALSLGLPVARGASPERRNNVQDTQIIIDKALNYGGPDRYHS
jgi:hypothetical protein